MGHYAGVRPPCLVGLRSFFFSAEKERTKEKRALKRREACRSSGAEPLLSACMYQMQFGIIRRNVSLCFAVGSSMGFLFGCGRSIVEYPTDRMSEVSPAPGRHSGRPRLARIRARCLTVVRWSREVYEKAFSSMRPKPPLGVAQSAGGVGLASRASVRAA